MYGSPSTPFVAEFIGTMNRLQATVVDGANGIVEHGGANLTIDAAKGLSKGDRVLVLIRPESVELIKADGATAANNLGGEIISHTFLGPVTRVKVIGDGVELTADVSTSRVESLPIGMRVVTEIPSEGVRVLSLVGEASETPELDDQ